MTPIKNACYFGKLEIVKLFLPYIDAENFSQYNPGYNLIADIYYGGRPKAFEIIRALVYPGADINARPQGDQTRDRYSTSKNVPRSSSAAGPHPRYRY